MFTSKSSEPAQEIAISFGKPMILNMFLIRQNERESFLSLTGHFQKTGRCGGSEAWPIEIRDFKSQKSTISDKTRRT
jgi:hypothetical protein